MCDYHQDTVVNLANCCVFCLEAGGKCVESVWHVLFECEVYRDVRVCPGVQSILKNPTSAFTQHRCCWTWPEMKTVRRLIVDVWKIRLIRAGGNPRRCRRVLHERAQDAWY